MARFIGRTTEFARLTARSAGSRPVVRVVAVTGEAGVGKSRLVSEGVRGGRRWGVTVLIGRSKRWARL